MGKVFPILIKKTSPFKDLFNYLSVFLFCVFFLLGCSIFENCKRCNNGTWGPRDDFFITGKYCAECRPGWSGGDCMSKSLLILPFSRPYMALLSNLFLCICSFPDDECSSGKTMPAWKASICPEDVSTRN